MVGAKDTVFRSRDHACVADIVLNTSEADEVEVAVETSEAYLTRFANCEIHQNTGERTTSVVVRSVFGQKVGVASTTRLDRESVEATVRRAERVAKAQPENPEFPGLPGPAECAQVNAYSEETASCPPERRASGVGGDLQARGQRRARCVRLVFHGGARDDGRELTRASCRDTVHPREPSHGRYVRYRLGLRGALFCERRSHRPA